MKEQIEFQVTIGDKKTTWHWATYYDATLAAKLIRNETDQTVTIVDNISNLKVSFYGSTDISKKSYNNHEPFLADRTYIKHNPINKSELETISKILQQGEKTFIDKYWNETNGIGYSIQRTR